MAFPPRLPVNGKSRGDVMMMSSRDLLFGSGRGAPIVDPYGLLSQLSTSSSPLHPPCPPRTRRPLPLSAIHFAARFSPQSLLCTWLSLRQTRSASPTVTVCRLAVMGSWPFQLSFPNPVSQAFEPFVRSPPQAARRSSQTFLHVINEPPPAASPPYPSRRSPFSNSRFPLAQSHHQLTCAGASFLAPACLLLPSCHFRPMDFGITLLDHHDHDRYFARIRSYAPPPLSLRRFVLLTLANPCGALYVHFTLMTIHNATKFGGGTASFGGRLWKSLLDR